MDLSAVPQGWLLTALASVSALAAAQAGFARFARWRRRRRILARVVRAGEGEREAGRYLQSAGFTLLGTQVAGTYSVVVDGVALPVDVRADLLVEKGARRFVVEVKTGKLAPRLETAATRRQLLEYLVAFEVDGVLLFDAEASSLRTVVFPDAGGPRRMSSRAPLVLVALALLLAAAVICSR